jgi:hypothetical protein
MRQSVKPQLASWDRAGHPSQVKLARFLAHVDAIAGPVLETARGRLERHFEGRGNVEAAERPQLSGVLRVDDVQRAGVDVMLAEASCFEFCITRHGVSVRLLPGMRHASAGGCGFEGLRRKELFRHGVCEWDHFGLIESRANWLVQAAVAADRGANRPRPVALWVSNVRSCRNSHGQN